MQQDPSYQRYKKRKSQKLQKLRHALEFVLIKGFEWWASLFPMRWNQAFGRMLGSLVFALVKKDRGIALYQLEFCYPEKSPAEREQIAKESFQCMTQTLMETLVVEKFRKNPTRWIRYENPEVVQAALAQGKGMVLLFGHLGNWEILPVIFDDLNFEGIAIEKEIAADRLNRLLHEKRAARNIRMIPRGDKASGKELLACFRGGKTLLYAFDQDMDVQNHFVDFFGRLAATPKGAANLAVKFGAPVVSALGNRNPDGTHTYHFRLLSQAPYTGGEEEEKNLTQAYTKAFEEHIRQYPGQWAWFHRRWKTRPEGEAQA